MKEMPRGEVALHVNDITNCKLNDAEWRIDKEPYSRANPPPAVRVGSDCFIICISCTPT